MLKHWSRQQRVVSRSSCESELYAAGCGVAECKGTQSVAADLGIKLKLVLRVDAKATEGTIHRSSAGRLRHMRVQDLWLQQELKEGRISLKRVPGWANPADACTKPLGEFEIERHMKSMNCCWG